MKREGIERKIRQTILLTVSNWRLADTHKKHINSCLGGLYKIKLKRAMTLLAYNNRTLRQEHLSFSLQRSVVEERRDDDD